MENYDEKFYKDFGLSKVPKKYLQQQELYNLFKKPPSEKKIMPRFYNFVENDEHQADLLTMPNDKGYKYILVVVDIATNKTDAEPLKDKNANNVLNGIKKIYQRGILKKPNKIIVDSGTEFKGQFQDYFKDNEINFKKALPGRHRQIAKVERHNQIIGKVLFMRMTAQELITGERSNEWIDDLEFVINKMNERYSHKPFTSDELIEKRNILDIKHNIIPINTKVRIALDEPRDVTSNLRLQGKFRSTDIRFSKQIYKVIGYIFDPINGILYKTDKQLKPNEKVAYTKQQLQIVSDTEQDPKGKYVIRGKPEQYIIKKLLDKRKYKGKIQYKVLWKGYDENNSTWEDKKNIPKYFIDEFEN